MSSTMTNQFVPDYAVPPGESLLDTIEALGMSQAELAERTGRPKKTINEIIKGKAPITPETALQLERVLGVPARFWNNLENNYRETLARIAEQERLQAHVTWLDEIPVKALVKLGWIRPFKDKVQQLQEVLNYFGVASPESWREMWLGAEVDYRKSPVFASEPGAVSAWLRRGELSARGIVCKPFDAGKFRAALSEIRRLTMESPEIFQSEVKRLCAEAGVAVVFVPELPQMRASGATWWLTPTKAVIQLSLRYKSDDHLWFSFFHEAGHILLHGKKDFFIEDNSKNDKEQEANGFAAETLLPAKRLRPFVQSTRLSKKAIENFAAEIGIAPGILVGRLQHDGYLPHTHCNDLKRRLRWAA
ncbi:MAG: plasmid maintenance system antidote [Geobacteraceae bacterium]|nr:MAG: plasmid maintenance system antidote [Geobacteraceae bacterium]